MRSLRSVVAPLAGALALLSAPAAIAGKKERPPEVQVGFVAAGELAAPDGSGVLEAGGVKVRVREVFGIARALWIHELTGSSSDPFEVVRDGKPAFRTFSVEIENGGPSTVLFNSAFVALKFGDSRKFPHGFGELYRVLSATIPDEAQLSRLAAVLEETSISVAPGAAAHKLLVFTGVSGAKSLELEVDGIVAGVDEVPMRVRFVRPK